MKNPFGFLSPTKAPPPPIEPPPPIAPSYYEMLEQLPEAQQSMVLGQIKRLYSGLAAAGTTAYAAVSGSMTPVATVQTSTVEITPGSERKRPRLIDLTPPSDAELDAMLSEKDEYGIHHIFGNVLINHYLKKYSSPTIEVVVKELSTGPHPYYKFNAMQLLYTVFQMTGAPDAVISSVNTQFANNVPVNSGSNMPADDVIRFLNKNGVATWEVPKDLNYEAFLSVDHTKPVIIEYLCTKHKYEDDTGPDFWTIFCILFRKERLLLPFNDTSAGLILGSQFLEQDWDRLGFKNYYKTCLHNKICPVVDSRPGKTQPSSCIRELKYLNAWTIAAKTRTRVG